MQRRSRFQSKMSSSSTSCRWATFSMLFLSILPSILCFNLHMEYKPPVKSSVSKLHDRRFSRDSGKLTSKPRSSSSKAAYAGAIAAPSPSPAASFERRMRQMVFGGARTQKKVQQPQRHLPPNVMTVETLQDYKNVVVGGTKMVAVRFYAPWCKACKAVAPHFYKLATMFPDAVFVDVPVNNQNTSLHQGLGVPSLPFGHIYHPTAGLVEELKLTRKHITEFKKSLTSYIDGSCEVPDDIYQEA